MSEITERIVALTDGVSEKDDTSIYATGAYILAGNDSGASIYDGLFRWQTVNVPNGASVSYATLKVFLGALSTNNFKGALWGIDEDDTEVWSASSRGSTRVKTTASVSADVADWNNFAVGEWMTIDVTAIVQEIINRTGWVLGNDIGIVLLSDADPGNDDIISLHRYYGSYIQDPLTYSPQLIIQYGASHLDDWTPVLTSIMR